MPRVYNRALNAPKEGTSPSLVILHRLAKKLGSYRSLARALGYTAEYISRLINGRAEFRPGVDEMQRIARIMNVSPMAFPEYTKLYDKMPSPSHRLLLDRMFALDLTRKDLSKKTGISLTYMYEVTRGDLAFFKQPEMLEKLAKILGVEPTEFKEYAPFGWTPEQMEKAGWVPLHRLQGVDQEIYRLKRKVQALKKELRERQEANGRGTQAQDASPGNGGVAAVRRGVRA